MRPNASGLAPHAPSDKHEETVNEKNTNPVARGARPRVVQRAIRCCLAHAEAPECLWPWALTRLQYSINQSTRRLYNVWPALVTLTK